MKIVKTGKNRIKVSINVGDCEVDIVIKKVRESKPVVHIEDIPVDYRRDNTAMILNFLIMAVTVVAAVAIFMMMTILS